MCAFEQFPHGCFLSHLTFLLRQVTHDRGFSPELGLLLPGEFELNDEVLWTPEEWAPLALAA